MLEPGFFEYSGKHLELLKAQLIGQFFQNPFFELIVKNGSFMIGKVVGRNMLNIQLNGNAHVALPFLNGLIGQPVNQVDADV